MKTTRLQKLLALSVLLLLLLVPAAKAQFGQVAGKVVMRGIPQTFVEVKLLDMEGTVINGRLTDEMGEFGFETLRPGSYRLRVSLHDFTRTVTVHVSADKSRSLDMDMTPPTDEPSAALALSRESY